MDDAESVELGQTGVEEPFLGDECDIAVTLHFKTGGEQEIKFRAPVWTPIYGEPLTDTSLFNIIASAYSYGEAPFLCLPTGDGGYRFVDLSTTNFMDVKVTYD